MRTVLSAVVAAALLVVGFLGTGRAALDGAAPRAPTLEVLVFEHIDCVYCQVFRRDVLPKYRHSVRADVAPLRFLDVNASDAMPLNARVDTVPTVVVMREGQEVGRIVGYWGPSNFFKMLAHIIGQVE